MDENEIKKIIEQQIKKIVPEYLKTQAFVTRKITDTPTDRYQVTPMGYVNLYGSVSGRPQNSVIGQQYFATDLNYPIFRDSNYQWRNGVGSVVG